LTATFCVVEQALNNIRHSANNGKPDRVLVWHSELFNFKFMVFSLWFKTKVGSFFTHRIKRRAEKRCPPLYDTSKQQFN
jgi:hypothetical protein